MPIRWNYVGCALEPHSTLWDEYQADPKVKYDVAELVALWKYHDTGSDYGDRSIPELGEPIHEVTKNDIERWVKQLEFFELSEQEIKEYRDAYRKYAMGLVGMQVWADRL